VRKRHVGAVSGIAVAALALTIAPSTAQAGPSPAPAAGSADGAIKTRRGGDSLPNPLADAQSKLREEAVAKLLSGEAKLEGSGASRTIKIPGNTSPQARGTDAAKGRWVWYPVNREESIFSILTDFGSKTMAATGGTPGPLHNQIPEPDRNWDGSATDDNSTYWKPDFNRSHYLNMMFGPAPSFRDFYQKQSQGRFLAKGDVSNWVKVPYNQARYGSNEISEADGYWNYIKDTATAWFNSQKAMGKTDAQIKTYLRQFDKVDRYDYDGDGVYLEPDGYIDHFQAIHAGEGEEAGASPDAIWSHRWYAFSTNYGVTGPSFNKAGGVPLGNSGIWIGDYTTEPENGGLGVFTHEFGHDLGLRDYYDTADGTGMGNSTAFWSLMSSGSWLNDGNPDIGTKPGYMGAHEKLMMGWLDYKLVQYGQNTDVKLGIANKDALHMPQAVAVLLPKRTHIENYNKPYAGNYEWWSGSGDDLQNTMSRALDLTGASTASLNMMMWAEIEEDYDYLYAEVSTDGGSTWKSVWSYTGVNPEWVPVSINLNAYAGKKRSTSASVTAPTAGSPRPAPSSTTSSSRRARRPCCPTAPRTATTAGRSRASSAPPAPRRSSRRTTTSPRTGSTTATTTRCATAPTTSVGPTPGRTGSSASPSRTACWSGTSTTTTPTTTPTPTRVKASRFPSTSTPS